MKQFRPARGGQPTRGKKQDAPPPVGTSSIEAEEPFELSSQVDANLNSIDETNEAPIHQASSEQVSNPTAIRMDFDLLIPIWGDSYIRRFAELGLRSLLAPGNLPWLSQIHCAKATILTTRDGAEKMRAYASFIALENLVQVSFIEIEDLIAAYGRNYAVILTRAYNRAMALSPDLIGRNFIYLVSDQVFADGSLKTVAQAMEAGADACLACTPRLDADALVRKLSALGTSTELVMSCRQMADLVINYPHPTLVAKMVQEDTVHLSVAHQFFWRPAPDTLVSRCFLLHMICIRPTCRPRDIAAPCDFSFVAELAPGGTYHYLSESDSFLAIELQDPHHETEFITSFKLGPADVAEAISAWATPMHHEMVDATFLFRSGNSSYPMADAVALSQSYIDKLFSYLTPPRGHRYHPFWLGAVGAQLLQAPSAISKDAAEIPLVLTRLIERQMTGPGTIDLGISVSDHPSPIDAILARSTRAAVRIPASILYSKIQDIAAPGGRILVVLTGGLSDFFDLFSDRTRLSRLLRVVGPGRSIFLCYYVSISDLRSGNPNRLQLYRALAARLSLFAHFGSAPVIHDLAPGPLERARGFVIEIVPDDTAAVHSIAFPRFRDPDDDPLLGRREMLSPPI